uniref:2Fe-2S ferredoxin-type domain-containing protein n=1 Tax=Proboscia inermis TaxID=420281 RepID=A0A6T8PBG2_9STRA|mmetsp:Transcript_10213/g.11677  ORF Transcript_10213/g.11677 Transcript_10213/m.11677 type:complete len:143 (+) Transcript_10213:54-482(+)
MNMNKINCAIFLIALIVLSIEKSAGYVSHQTRPQHSTRNFKTKLDGFGDAFKGAFANDDVGEKQSAGLKGGPKYNENVSINGKSVKAIVNQKLALVATAARVKISYDCKAGDCGTCIVKLNGRKVKACQTLIPKGKCNIQTL